MRCERLAVVTDHLVCIAVVGSDEDCAAHAERCVANPAYALVNGLNSLDSRLKYACVTDHVAVSKVEDNNVILVGFNLLADCIANLVCTHLRLEIESRNIGGVDKNSVFTLKCLFLASVEEECNVSIFLRLSDSELSFSL